ncbi:hypothetical protein CDD80_5537 [Ophiocordyceps camponoti-rufipedis]|uniref:C4-dicarboxylate transporter/malic acid transport protein n=1 Tax=Ophiocordyceps camponoti-rufipedis TaxID=2004952 RepID=A0A2C5YTK1_9HYPO|nr:hypothetical protein CDD80_5537 [Ophiocordyceps camponoti-rufipedis]
MSNPAATGQAISAPDLGPWSNSNSSTRRNSLDGSGRSVTEKHRSPSNNGFNNSQLEPGFYYYPGEKAGSSSSNPSGLGNIEAQPAPVDPNDPDRPRLPLRQRLHHFTWAWYTLSMSTGGLAVLIFAQPHQFMGLRTIGLVVYVINLFIFTTITILLLTRFFLHPGDLTRSLMHPREGFFVPTFFLAVATIITGTDRYLIPKNDVALVWAISGAFWAYLAFTLVLAVGQYSYVFASHSFGLQTMMPTWILPIFPIMLSGTIASVIAETQPEIAATPIIVAGLTCQGLGLSVAFMMYAHMIGRLMQSGLPNREHRPGLFMCVGPPSFTALALIGMANGLPVRPSATAEGTFLDVGVIKTVALLCAIFLWALSLWWFSIAALAIIQSPPKYFHLGCWAMVFPNSGFTLATIAIGRALGSEPVLWVGTAMSIIILIAYLIVLFFNIRAVVVQDIMYPNRDEDVEDH